LKEGLAEQCSKWIVKISEENKKGLKVIQKVIVVDGKKRFKKDESEQ
jgi:hypothetical protein